MPKKKKMKRKEKKRKMLIYTNFPLQKSIARPKKEFTLNLFRSSFPRTGLYSKKEKEKKQKEPQYFLHFQCI